MLDQLKRVHDEMLALIDRHELLTRSPTPVTDDIARLRLQIVDANRRRIDLLDEIYEHLAGAPEKIRRQVEVYRAEDREMLAAASSHLGTWTIERIRTQWPAYQQSCTAAYARQRNRIRSEQQLIYPFIE